MKTIFHKEYDDESLGQDLGRDICESIIEDYNPLVADIPVDEHGFRKGTFKVTIVWSEE